MYLNLCFCQILFKQEYFYLTHCIHHVATKGSVFAVLVCVPRTHHGSFIHVASSLHCNCTMLVINNSGILPGIGLFSENRGIEYGEKYAYSPLMCMCRLDFLIMSKEND